MSYKTYTTEALVCGSKNHNTSDKNYLLFTKNAGMLWASARSVREERSKQRCALQDFSHIRVSLVKGKSGWRVGSTEALSNPFLQTDSRVERTLIHFVITQLRRYVHGEVALERVYDDAYELYKEVTLFKEKSPVVQRLFFVRLLSELGYIAPQVSWKGVIDAMSLREALAVYTTDMEDAIAKAVQEATEVSHL